MLSQIAQHRTVPILEENNEEAGAFSFVDKFLNMGYNNSTFLMKICGFRDALYDLLSDSNKDKILILYLHEERSDFSKRFCSYISNKEVGEILGEHFILLGWDIGEEGYRDDLIKGIYEFEHMVPCIRMIEQKIPAAVFINFEDIEFQICSILKDNVGIDSFILTLNSLSEVFCRYDEISEADTSENLEDSKFYSYEEFQQKMCNGLGDRDYDCFESDQLEHLKTKISFAFFGPPSDISGYNDKQKEETTKMYEKILEKNDEYSEYKNQVQMAVVYNCLVSLEQKDSTNEFSPVPVFILRKCRDATNPCRIVIDHTGRVYDSWNDYLEENKFCKCLMVFPENGRYTTYENGKVKLQKLESPACGIGRKALKVADITGSVLGIGSMGVAAATAIPAITFAPVLLAGALATGLAVGVYSVGRSVHTLVDRKLHDESMNVTEAEARAAYIGVAAGAAGMLGAGANILVAQAAASGIAVGTAGRIAANTINVANIGIGGLAIGNSAVEIAMRWWIDDETPTTLSVLQLSASIFFFGHAIYSFKTAGTIIEENQTSVFDDFKSMLRSNKHRKMFDKLALETIRENVGNVQKGRAEVISAIRNIKTNRDEIFAFLSRSNGKFNELGIKFSARGGEITLNGFPIDPSEINSISRSDVGSFYSDLSARPRVQGTISTRHRFDFDLRNFMTSENFMVISKFVTDLISCKPIEEKILLILKETLIYFKGKNDDVWGILKLLEGMLPFNEFPRKLTELILSYIQKEAENLLVGQFGMGHPDQRQKLFFIRLVCDELIQAFLSPIEQCLSKFITFCTHWIINAYRDYDEKNQRKCLLEENEKRQNQTVCKKCAGYYYKQ